MLHSSNISDCFIYTLFVCIQPQLNYKSPVEIVIKLLFVIIFLHVNKKQGTGTNKRKLIIVVWLLMNMISRC